MGKLAQEVTRGGREQGHHMGMGHGFKKLTKMAFAPRLPQDQRGGSKASEERATSHMTPLYRHQYSHDPKSSRCPLQSIGETDAPVLRPGQDPHLANHRQLCQEAGEAVRDKTEVNPR